MLAFWVVLSILGLEILFPFAEGSINGNRC